MDASNTSVVYWEQKVELKYCAAPRDPKQGKFCHLCELQNFDQYPST